MRMITGKQQKEATMHLINIIDSVQRQGVELETIEDVADLAFIIGDENMVKTVYKKMWGGALR